MLKNQTTMDKLNKCRLCLKLGEFCSVFENDDSIKLSEMVMSFANIDIYEGDGLPDKVCNSCIENLSSAYIFKLQCEKIDHILRKSQQPQPNHHTKLDYKGLMEKEFRVHKTEYAIINSENDDNSVKDGNIIFNDGRYHDVSDETDSDVDSIKCVYCNEAYNNFGAHTCHVTCTIENDQLQRASSTETLVANDATPQFESALSLSETMESTPPFRTPINHSRIADTTPTFQTPIDHSRSHDNTPPFRTPVNNSRTADITPPFETPTNASNAHTNAPQVSCVLCDDIYSDYDSYVLHINKCTANVKLQHFVCPVCHEIFTDKLAYLQHLKNYHFVQTTLGGIDCVDTFGPLIEKTRKPKPVRRQIGWSVEDIYQEIECRTVDDKETPASSPFKTFLSKLGNESFSRQSTPKRVSFRKLIEDGKTKTSNYLQRFKKKDTYSPLKGRLQISTKVKASLPESTSDSEYHSPSGTSEESWKMKQNLICACDKKVFMLSENLNDRERIVAMLSELGGVVAENTKMEMLATHFISVLPDDTFTGMMVCALSTGKWLLHVNFVYDSFRGKRFLQENLYEWKKHPKILELDNTSVEVAKAAVYWHLELQALNAKFPFEGKQIVLIMKKKYRQYYQMIFKTLKAKPVTYDPRTPGSCCSADYCFVDMKVIEKVKLRFFARHDVPVFPYQYILVYLLNRGRVDNERKYLLQDCKKIEFGDTFDYFNSSF